MVRTCACPMEEGTNLTGFDPYRAHEFLVEVYDDCLHHNNRTYLDRAISDEALWKHLWRRLDAQLYSCYAMPLREVRWWFTFRLADEWRGVRNKIWNSERPLVFACVIFGKNSDAQQAREIRKWISGSLYLWGVGFREGLA